jgi:hypothetical protein
LHKVLGDVYEPEVFEKYSLFRVLLLLLLIFHHCHTLLLLSADRSSLHAGPDSLPLRGSILLLGLCLNTLKLTSNPNKAKWLSWLADPPEV